MSNSWNHLAITRTAASATAVSVAMLACTLLAPRQAHAQVQGEPTSEGSYIAFETPDRGTVGTEPKDPLSITDGTQLLVDVEGSRYTVEVTRPASEPRVLERVEVFAGTALAARAEARSDGSMVLVDANGTQFTGQGELQVTTAMLGLFDPNVLLILEERFQDSLYELDYVVPDPGTPQASIVRLVGAILACCIKAKISCEKVNGDWECSKGDIEWNCGCL